MVIDDQMEDAGVDKRIANLFTGGPHHCNLSAIYIVQNFHQWKGRQSVSRYSHYLVLFKNLRDKLQNMTRLSKCILNTLISLSSDTRKPCRGDCSWPVPPAMQKLQDSMDGLLFCSDPGEYEKAKQHMQLQNNYLTFIQQIKQTQSRTNFEQ